MPARPDPFKLGRSSRKQIETLEPDLSRVLERGVEILKFSVIEGRRCIETQIAYLRKGVSKTIDSRHVPRDGDGVHQPNGLGQAADLTSYQNDVSPWPLGANLPEVTEKKKHRCYVFQGVAPARPEGVDVRVGGDREGHLGCFDQPFYDLGRAELRMEPAKPEVSESPRDDLEAALDATDGGSQ